MMTNLFSSFDPMTSLYLSLNWISMMIGLIILPFSIWVIPSRINMMWIKITSILNKEFKILINMNLSKGNTTMFISLFMFILFSNFLSLFPYIFSSTSHLSLTLSLSLPLWLTFMIYGWMNNTIHMFSHLVPQGTPMILMPFMVCIETISNLIRPGTLAIRLTANMIAGHLLLTLLASTGNKLSIFMINFLIITQFLLIILESAVAIIQSYVFTILVTLYSSEIN
uniref:ATP synthase subunit a n=1 Tax=Emeia pseudosauteri TaxID=2592744 RepID=A0A5C0Q0G8_9COLE|nr:ATP synthase F0 subunit 6 [Emeia pseudosauteri]QEJ81582.1 ATP synthase F0 subunit 6 [Emeia pseudosauteri]